MALADLFSLAGLHGVDQTRQLEGSTIWMSLFGLISELPFPINTPYHLAIPAPCLSVFLIRHHHLSLQLYRHLQRAPILHLHQHTGWDISPGPVGYPCHHSALQPCATCILDTIFQPQVSSKMEEPEGRLRATLFALEFISSCLHNLENSLGVLGGGFWACLHLYVSVPVKMLN